jgi:hypothetical protein
MGDPNFFESADAIGPRAGGPFRRAAYRTTIETAPPAA